MPHGDILSERGSFTIFLANKIPQSNSSSTFFLFLSTQKVLWKFHALLKWLKGMDRVYTYIHRQIHTRAHTHTHIFIFRGECFHVPQKCHCQAITCRLWQNPTAVQSLVRVPGCANGECFFLTSSGFTECCFQHEFFSLLNYLDVCTFLSWLPCNVELLLDAGFGWVRRKKQDGSISRS